MVNSDDFAKRLQIVMDYYGLTSSALADAIAFNRSSISHLLSGRNKPSLEFVMKILEKFPEVKLYWLMNGKGNFPETEIAKETLNQNISFEEESGDFNTIKTLVTEQARSIVPDDTEIDRIVIFFKDGTFKEYKN